MMKNYLELESKILDTIKTVFDPEIPVNIYDLGLVYEINVKEKEGKKYAHILMTLTSPNCPVAESLPIEVEEKVGAIEGVDKTEVEITFEPPWSKDMMSDSAMLELGLL